LFNGLRPNGYRIVALHDENKNMKLDKNILGWPKKVSAFAIIHTSALVHPDLDRHFCIVSGHID